VLSLAAEEGMSVYMVTRKSGTFPMIDISYVDPTTGRKERFRKVYRRLTKREAEKLEKVLYVEFTTKPASATEVANQTNFGDFAAHWVERRRPSWSPRTYDNNRAILRNHFIPAFGGHSLGRITTHQIEGWVAERRALPEPPRSKTIANQLSLLRRLFNDAKRWGFAVSNPVDQVERVRPDPPRRKKLIRNVHFRAFLDAALEHGGPAGPLLCTALLTGMRLGELAALQWDDVDFDANKIHVRRSVSRGVVTIPKSGQARSVTMSQDLVEILAGMSRQQGELVFPYRPAPGHTSGGAQHALETPWYDPNRVRHPIARVCKALGIPNRGIHSLRHSFGSALANAGVAPLHIQHLMGHSDLRTTQIYLQGDEQALQQAVNQLGAGRQAKPGEAE
jgi:integrase